MAKKLFVWVKSTVVFLESTIFLPNTKASLSVFLHFHIKALLSAAADRGSQFLVP